jgi:hypothetical protein
MANHDVRFKKINTVFDLRYSKNDADYQFPIIITAPFLH